MILIKFNQSQQTQLPSDNNDVTAISKKDIVDKTDSSKAPTKEDEPNITTPIRTKSIKSTDKFAVDSEILTTSYSENYISHNISLLITHLILQFDEWEQSQDLTGALSHISKIKNLLSEYCKYLYQKPHTRILISTLQLVFENDNWESLTKKQINQIQVELNRFKAGTVDIQSLKQFSKQLYQNKVKIIKKTQNAK